MTPIAMSQTYLPDQSSLQSAAARGQGGVAAASSNAFDSLFLNPATPAFQKNYSVNLSYLADGNTLGAGIVDTKSGPVGGGIFYLRRDLRNVQDNPSLGSGARIDEIAGVSLFGQVSEDVSVGLLGRYNYRRSFTGGIESASSWNGDLGANVRASQQLYFGLAAQNLLSDEEGFGARKFTLGSRFLANPRVSFGADVAYIDIASTLSGRSVPAPDKTVSWGIGADVGVSDSVALRAGFSDVGPWNMAKASVGLGFKTKSFSLDYSFESATKGAKFSLNSFVLSAFF